MTYPESLQYVESLARFGVHLGLERIEALLSALGKPQEKLACVHIAGTNGKGSTSTMLSQVCQTAGLHTGLFISPYVLCFRERMQIDGEMISEEAFASYASRVATAAETLRDAGSEITQFEWETALALLWFYESACDIVCLEVGLGGRFDATNVLPRPLVQVIASISLDHTAILGDTLEKIAFEKAGIIKTSAPTVVYPLQDAPALQVLETACAKAHSPLICPDTQSLHIENENPFDTRFRYQGTHYRKSLSGRIQIYNCLTVIETVRQLQILGLPIQEHHIVQGLAETHMPARLEVLSQTPFVLLDGAHNPAGAQVLAETLDALPQKNIILMMGVMADKNHRGILDLLLPKAKRFYAVPVQNLRACPVSELVAEAKERCPHAEGFDSLSEAIDSLYPQLGQDDDALVVCGSLYLAAEARPLLLQKQEA